MRVFRLLVSALSLLPLCAAEYHVDFAAGDDARDGLGQETAFKHCPGDALATGVAKATVLQPGDAVRFKGGVVYYGTVMVAVSGAAGKPILFDGNSAGSWGIGPAVIDAGDLVTGWKACSTAEEAKGNPRWGEIVYADVPKVRGYKMLNLCDAEGSLPVAQHPNPKDFAWQEHSDTYFVKDGRMAFEPVPPQVAPEHGFRNDRALPIEGLRAGAGAVIAPTPGAAFTWTLAAPQQIVAVGVTPQPNYAPIKDVVVLGDGRELLRFSLAPSAAKAAEQRFELAAPASVTRLTFRVESMHPSDKPVTWSKIGGVSAFTADGVNLLAPAKNLSLTDPANLGALSGGQADWFAGLTYAYHGGNNHIIYLPVKGYDPATGTLLLPMNTESQYKETKYCFFNGVRLIDQPGEYSVEDAPDSKKSRVYLLPRTRQDGQPSGIVRGARKNGVLVDRASHIAFTGFRFLHASESAFVAKSPYQEPYKPDGNTAAGLTLRGCEMSLAGQGIEVSGYNDVRIEGCHIHDNPGHAKGIVIHTGARILVTDTVMERNTSTALDYYGCTDSQVVACTVRDNRGSHANGLTFYLGCRNILVERNVILRTPSALTVQEVVGFDCRNNVFDGSVGIWQSLPLQDLRFVHNTIVNGFNPQVAWSGGLFIPRLAPDKLQGLVVRNNIIDGLSSDRGVFAANCDLAGNFYIHRGRDQKDGLLGAPAGEEPDMAKIFVDPGKGDFRLRAGSPAIGAGVETGVPIDATGQPRPAGRHDAGAYAFH